MLYMGRDDITGNMDFEGMMDSIERAYKIYESESFDMPDRIHISHGEDTLLYMPCFSNSVFGTKVIGVFPGNSSKGKPSVDGIMILNSSKDGSILSIMDGAAITAVRTGAVGGCAVRRLAGEGVKSLGVIGTGTQAFYQALFACHAAEIEEVSIFGRSADKANELCKRLRAQLGDVHIVQCKSAEELLKKSDIVITATSAQKTVLPDNPDILEGKLFVAIGSYKPDMRELPDALFPLLSNVYIDTDFASEESGDIKVPLEKGIIYAEKIERFSNLVAEEKYVIQDGTRLFKSVGMALFDIVVAKEIYERATAQGRGTNLK
ncbi:ornithine cyclodeaminase [Peptoclostridium litorale DSM 5388]|uniref:Alanine dehydrogenase Ala n=1 Tax=Peptoclostridium litorale DSM 5388 TaxID=1121324 RepID=A0A069RKX2_PEPLI|nr:ornithine cyclodeaminase family protein [Peptoclostridium litorale]KDR96770.1 alanine dehydrogenase Ala [Peptoclostridium litorale DSM 5388]SIO34596.1 ornithine cyclodeaminase [Peptoclostridium litorale DSM 5388]